MDGISWTDLGGDRSIDPPLFGGTTGAFCLTGPPTAFCFVGPPTEFCARAGWVEGALKCAKDLRFRTGRANAHLAELRAVTKPTRQVMVSTRASPSFLPQCN